MKRRSAAPFSGATAPPCHRDRPGQQPLVREQPRQRPCASRTPPVHRLNASCAVSSVTQCPRMARRVGTAMRFNTPRKVRAKDAAVRALSVKATRIIERPWELRKAVVSAKLCAAHDCSTATCASSRRRRARKALDASIYLWPRCADSSTCRRISSTTMRSTSGPRWATCGHKDVGSTECDTDVGRLVVGTCRQASGSTKHRPMQAGPRSPPAGGDCAGHKGVAWCSLLRRGSLRTTKLCTRRCGRGRRLGQMATGARKTHLVKRDRGHRAASACSMARANRWATSLEGIG